MCTCSCNTPLCQLAPVFWDLIHHIKLCTQMILNPDHANVPRTHPTPTPTPHSAVPGKTHCSFQHPNEVSACGREAEDNDGGHCSEHECPTMHCMVGKASQEPFCGECKAKTCPPPLDAASYTPLAKWLKHINYSLEYWHGARASMESCARGGCASKFSRGLKPACVCSNNMPLKCRL
jgi:hypothetical protein